MDHPLPDRASGATRPCIGPEGRSAMDGNTMRWLRAAAGAATVVAVSVGCGSDQAALVGAPVTEQVADLTVVSDDRRVTTGAACIADIPDDVADCPGYRDALARIELDETRKGALIVPADVATGGYRIRIDGAPLSELDRILDDQYQVFRIPVDTVAEPGPTTLTVEALRSAGHPKAIWQFLLDDPAAPPT
jgi:hypothetical protein